MRHLQQEANRLHKALEDAGIKLDCVATDILGASGGRCSTRSRRSPRPAALAGLAQGSLRAKNSALIEAFEGVRFDAQDALVIGAILRHLDFLDAQIAAPSRRSRSTSPPRATKGPSALLSWRSGLRARWTGSSSGLRRC